MLTDAAIYYTDGTLGQVGQKVYPVAHLDCAFAARGPKLFTPLVCEHLSSHFSSFDELLAGVVNGVRVAVGAYAVLELCQHGSTFDLIIAGWSRKRRQAESYLVCDHDRYGVPAWTLNPLAPVSLMPWDEDTAGRLCLTEREAQGHMDPVRDGLRILEAQRHTKGLQGEETEPSHGVGGFAQLTTVTAEGISTRVLRRWPDVIGARLDPTRVVQ